MTLRGFRIPESSMNLAIGQNPGTLVNPKIVQVLPKIPNSGKGFNLWVWESGAPFFAEPENHRGTV